MNEEAPHASFKGESGRWESRMPSLGEEMGRVRFRCGMIISRVDREAEERKGTLVSQLECG